MKRLLRQVHGTKKKMGPIVGRSRGVGTRKIKLKSIFLSSTWAVDQQRSAFASKMDGSHNFFLETT